MRTPPRSALALVLALAGCGDNGGDTSGASGTTGDATGDATTGTASDPGTNTGNPTTGTPTTATTGASASTTNDPTGTSDGTSSTTNDPSGTTTTTTTTDGETTTTTGGGGEACVDDHRVIAYVANWQACPTPEQMAQWSHVILAFAVTYTWTPNGNVCDEACTIGAVPGCNGKSLAELTADLHAAGVKVLLSFGGAGMGGLWEGTCGQMTKCWDSCLNKVDSLVDTLTAMVADNDLDGVDIDYEYCLHDAAHTDFVAGLTTGLRAALDELPGERKLVTHAPMDHTLDQGDPYFALVEQHAGAIDFLMPQYYNGGMSAFDANGLAAIETHYRALVDGPFGGDASRVVFGHCIEPGCAPVATQPAALEVAQEVASWYPNDGGVFFWAHPNETDGWFSKPFRDYYDSTFCGE
jgi:chitinase